MATINPYSRPYPTNDLGSVYTHYNPKTGKNEPTPNVLPNNNPKEDNKDGKDTK